MKAIILAAGRGDRMGSLTDHIPKPLLTAGGKMLIEYQIEKLARAGFRHLVINHAYLGAQIEAALGDGAGYSVEIQYVPEPPGALDTGGGIRNALPLLGNEPFVVTNGDIWTDFPFETLPDSPQGLVHLVLVDCPPHHPGGDFAMKDGWVVRQGSPMLTYSGIGVFRPELFQAVTAARFPLAPLLYQAIDSRQARGEYYAGYWQDVGTPERLAELKCYLSRDRRLE